MLHDTTQLNASLRSLHLFPKGLYLPRSHPSHEKNKIQACRKDKIVLGPGCSNMCKNKMAAHTHVLFMLKEGT